MTRELDRYIEKLKVEIAEHAAAALKTPKDRTSFGYGRAHGKYVGLLRAEQLLMEAIEEEQSDGDK